MADLADQVGGGRFFPSDDYMRGWKAASDAAQKRVAEIEHSLMLANRQVDNMADVLRRCQHKLTLCIENHGAEYIGGTEHSHLMKMIDAALPSRGVETP